MSEPNQSSGNKASDPTIVVGGGTAGKDLSSGRSSASDKTVVPMAGRNVDIANAAIEALSAPAMPVVARGTKPSTPSPSRPVAPAYNPEVSEVTGLWGPGQTPRPGLSINQYELIREIGAGGMGTVYLARDLKLGRKVAIKILNSHHPELTQRFIIEARATARCSHENIVIIYEVGEYGGQPYMVLEFLQGTVLTELVSGAKRLPPARAVELIVPVVRALVVAHEQGIVHRDLKPDNIFVTDQGTIKVLDFGIAKVRDQADKPAHVSSSASIRVPSAAELAGDGNTNLTRQGVIMGTMKYMSPEQWGIGVEIDHRTDIWAVGVILFRLLAGKHPLAPLQGNQLVVTAMLDKAMPKLREAVSDVPQGLRDVVDRCLMKNKDQRFKDARELLRALEPYLPGRFSTVQLELDESPYAGLSSFQESDASRFFGRTHEIAAAVNKIRDRPVMAVIGPSGVGKSSFVRAGLVPALKGSGEAWETLVIRPGRSPLAAIAAMMTPMVGGTTSQTVNDDLKEHAEIARQLAAEPGHMGQVLRSRAKRSGTKILLFVDQFEELYTLVPDPAERAAFTACLSGAADDPSAPVRVVLSLRSDFLDRVGEDPHLMREVMQGLFFLTPPNRDGLRDALVQPSEMAGYHFETPAMVDEMLSHLATTPGALPLLQFAATKLWEERDSGRKLLTQAAYTAMGGIAGALASHADSVLGELPPSAQAMARQLFLRLITPERTRAIVSLAELQEMSPEPGDVHRLVEHLVGARLLVSNNAADGSAHGSTVEIVHESLIHRWPSLRRWLDETQEDAQFVEQLRIAARQWHTKGRDPGMLWTGDTADEAIRWARRHHESLPEIQRGFLAAVISAATRAERRRRAATIGVVTLLTLLLVAAALALFTINRSQKSAERNARIAARSAIVAKEQAEKAKVAEADAKRSLAAAEEKERQRLVAEAQAAESDKQRAAAELAREKTGEQLTMTYAELESALSASEAAEIQAKSAKVVAEKSATEAVIAKRSAEKSEGEARAAKTKVDQLLANEQKRVKELEERIGEMIKTLK